MSSANPIIPRNAKRRGRDLALLLVPLLGLSCPVPVSAQDPAPSAPESAAGDGERADGGPSAIPQTPVQFAERMGVPGYFFLGCFLIASIIAVWFAIERLVVLRRGRVIPRPFVQRFLQQVENGQLDRREALKVCQENGSPVAEVFAHGIRKWGKPSVEVEQAIIDGGERQVSHMRKHLRVLNGVATVTPLLGLLGTVIGMIQAFNKIADADAMGRPEELAVGIALALLTTAAGLTIAIPSLIIYLYLTGRVDSLVIEMDRLAQSVVHLISAEGLADAPASAGPVPSGPHTTGGAAERQERKAV